jgi:DNA-binding response OmpR family regulator
MPVEVPEDSAPKRSQLNILLAEDDADQRFLLAAMLRADGYRVSETADGESLRTHLMRTLPVTSETPAHLLVIADLKLRGPDALAVLGALHAAGRRPRFILMTAYWSSEVYRVAKELGVLAVFAKPFDFHDLRVTVRALEQAREP